MPNPPVVCHMGDGISPSVESRCRNIASRVPVCDVFVYGGDVYQTGTAAEFVSFDNTYGDTAAAQSPPGQNFMSVMAHTLGNHEYKTFDATSLRPTAADDYYLGGSPARTTRSLVRVDLTKTDTAAVYSSAGLVSADAQKVAASQWGHLNYLDLNGWRLLFIDTGRANTDNGAFPDSGAYRDAVQALVDGATYRKLIVFGHHPKFTSGSVHGEPRPEMDPLWDMIAPRALLYISGHNHNYERQNARLANEAVAAQQPHGCVQIVAGTAGTSLNGFVPTYGTPAAVAFKDDTIFGFVKLTLNPATVGLEYFSVGASGSNTPTLLDSQTLYAAPPPQAVTVTNSASGASMPWTASTATSWLSVTPAFGGAGTAISVSADPTGMSVGTYNGSFSIAATGATNTPLSVPVTLTISTLTTKLTLGSASLSDTVDPATDFRTYFGDVVGAGSSRRRFNTNDDGTPGFSMDTLKIIDDPGGSGYLGVYHHLNATAGLFEGYVASSTNLLNWHREVKLADRWHQLTLVALSDGGILVAGEADNGGPGNWVKLRRYASRAALVAGTFTHEIDLPHRIVPQGQLAEGTPNIYSVSNPDVTQATIDIGFHYFNQGIADRQARGTLVNWTGAGWTASAQPQIDNAITSLGVAGNIGDRDPATFEGRQLLIVEGMGTIGDWSTWRLYAYDPTTQTAAMCPLTTPAGTVGGANPSTTRVKHPTIAGRFVRVMCVFVPTEVAGVNEGGELIFYKDSA